MSLFTLKGSIDPDATMDEDDVLNAKTALQALGHFETPPHGLTRFPDREMIDGVKSFQRANGLRVDGAMTPDGPTRRRINQSLARMQQGEPPRQSDDTDQRRAHLEAQLDAAHNNREAARQRAAAAEEKYLAAVETSNRKFRELKDALQISGIEAMADKLVEKASRRAFPPLPSTALGAISEEVRARKNAEAPHEALRLARSDVSNWDAEIERLRQRMQRLNPGP